MDNAKASIGTCELATGVLHEGQIIKQMTFRELAGPEEDILASDLPAAQKMTEVMINCTKAMGDVTEMKLIRSLVPKLVITDRWLYLVRLRAHSLGSDYEFKSKCPACNVEDKMLFDLHQLKVVRAPSADAVFKEITLPSGRKVRWHVADGAVDLKIEKIANAKNAATAALFARITEIDDKPADIVDVLQMPLRDRSALRKAIDESEGDLDDEFEAVCRKCGHEYRGELQLDGRTFFSL